MPLSAALAASTCSQPVTSATRRHGLVQGMHPDARQFDHLLAGFGRHGTAQGSVGTGLLAMFSCR